MRKGCIISVVALLLLSACAKSPQRFRSSFVEFDFPAGWTASADSSGGSLYVELLSPDSDAVMISAMQGIMPPEFAIDAFWSAYSRSLPRTFALEKSDSLRFCYFGGYEARCLDYILRGGNEVMRGSVNCFNASGNTFTLHRYASDNSMITFMSNTELIESTIYFP